MYVGHFEKKNNTQILYGKCQPNVHIYIVYGDMHLLLVEWERQYITSRYEEKREIVYKSGKR